MLSVVEVKIKSWQQPKRTRKPNSSAKRNLIICKLTLMFSLADLVGFVCDDSQDTLAAVVVVANKHGNASTGLTTREQQRRQLINVCVCAWKDWAICLLLFTSPNQNRYADTGSPFHCCCGCRAVCRFQNNDNGGGDEVTSTCR